MRAEAIRVGPGVPPLTVSAGSWTNRNPFGDGAPCAPSAELRACVTRGVAAAVLVVEGEIDPSTAAEFSDHLEHAFTGSSRVIVDLGEVTFMDSTGLAALFAAATREGRAQGSLVLRRPSSVVRRLLALTHADQVLAVEEPSTPGASEPTRVRDVTDSAARSERRRAGAAVIDPAGARQLPGPTSDRSLRHGPLS